MQKTINNKPVLLVGDVHGRFGALRNAIIKHDIVDAHLICVGDYGIGFHFSYQTEMIDQEKLNEFFKLRNINFYSIRGNHDDPIYFKGNTRLVLSNIELFDDYTIKDFNGEKFLLVGGAVSIDRIFRKEGIDYWIDEIFKFDPNKAEKCDVLITHSAPTWIGPFDKEGLSEWIARDPSLWEECLKERKEHNELVKLANPNRLYCGHFHRTCFIDFGDCYGRILDELEILEHRQRT